MTLRECSLTPFDTTSAYARSLDQQDPLRSFREQFWLPGPSSAPDVYLVGNSLGLQPKRTNEYVQAELEKWQRLGVKGHFESEHPWMPYHEFLSAPMARLIGAHADEVVMMNSLTANLHLMMATFYRPAGDRRKILIEEHAFPSDHYAVESQLSHHGNNPADTLVLVGPPHGQETLCEEAICQQIQSAGEELAVVLLPGVQYYTGQALDIPKLTRAAHGCGAIVGVDLAHAAGNIPLALHDWEVDFAVWCSYKYLNSGPGSVGGCFVHRRHATNTSLPRLAGWWGHDKATRFEMKNEFRPMPTAEGWQLSNPPILSLAAIRSSLDVFAEAGGIDALREKSLLLTGYFEKLLKASLGDRVEIITPNDPERRGCQLSLQIQSEGKGGRFVYERLESDGMVTDWREPNVIRAAPVPLYNSFEDVHRFVEALGHALEGA